MRHLKQQYRIYRRVRFTPFNAARLALKDAANRFNNPI